MRRGVAALTRLAYAGVNLIPLYASLTRACHFDAEAAGDVMDLALLSQLLGDAPGGLRLQARILDVQRLYRLAPPPGQPRLRLLCLAADMDIGGNTPVEFLVGDGGIDLFTLYLRPGESLPRDLPDHDAVMPIMPDDRRCRPVLDALTPALAHWPRPVINPPDAIARLDRDRLCTVIEGVPGVSIPPTRRIATGAALTAWNDVPLVVRPVGSHAGQGLARVHSRAEYADYLTSSTAPEIFLQPFVDYRSADRLYRKYRVVLIDGHAYPVHMAMGPSWSLWYLNAEMERHLERRAEEQTFMDGFATGFGKRHECAFGDIARRVGLEYVGLDCAETRDGRLLVFEADNALIVHDMDPPDVFPYKVRHMRRLFAGFQEMLAKRVRQTSAATAACA